MQMRCDNIASRHSQCSTKCLHMLLALGNQYPPLNISKTHIWTHSTHSYNCSQLQQELLAPMFVTRWHCELKKLMLPKKVYISFVRVFEPVVKLSSSFLVIIWEWLHLPGAFYWSVQSVLWPGEAGIRLK